MAGGFVPPSLVSSPDGTFTNDNTPTFEWTSIAGAAKYDIQADNDADFSSPEIDENVSENTYTPTVGLLDENYSWRVNAYDAENNATGWSSVWTILIDTAAPAAPSPSSPLNGSSTNDNTPTFTWGAVSDPSGVTYNIQVDNDADFSSPEISETGLTDTTFTPLTELPDENYSWRVRAVDGAGFVGDWSDSWTFVVDTLMPSLVSPADGATIYDDNTPTFQWDNNFVADNYEIWVDNDADFSSPEILENTTDNTHTSTTELADGNYSWRVRVWYGENASMFSSVWTLSIRSTAQIIIKFTQTGTLNTALDPANSQDSDDTYATFDADHDPLYRVQGSHDGSDLGTITNVEAFIEYHTVGIVDDYCYATFYHPEYTTEYAISLRRLYAREEEGIQYEGRSWDYYGFPPWSYFASPDLIGKVVNYSAVKGPDKGTFYIDMIGFRITYILGT